MLRKKQDYFHTDTKVVCIIDFDKSGDEEITNMVNEIANNKRKKGYQVKTIICRGENPGDVIKIAGILKLIPEDTTQLIIAAHSRFYTRDGAVAPIKPYSKNEDVRHIGEYQLAEVASFLSKILLKREYINEIKFYSCETAVNKTTYDPKTYSKLIPKPVDAKTEKNIKENEKADPENIKRATNNSGYQGMKKSQELFKNNINLNIMEKEKKYC